MFVLGVFRKEGPVALWQHVFVKETTVKRGERAYTYL